MKLLIKNVKIVDPNSPHNKKKRDIFFKEGIIERIHRAVRITGKDVEIIDAMGQFISPGWFDMRVNFCDPGYEYKENLQNGLKVAAQSGFTGAGIMPSTNPSIHNKSGIEYIINSAKGSNVNIHPFGTISVKREGKELSEMYDMNTSGAVAFTDDKKPVSDSGLMLRALMYSKNFNGLVVSFPYDESLAHNGQMHEGIMSTSLGLKGIPSLSEEVMVIRDLKLAEYADARIHFTCVSTARSVELIRQAKAKGMKVTADVCINNLVLYDEYLHDFDSNYKFLPPLRTKDDIAALKQGLKDGTIDVICSDHTPEDIENKQCEFEHAANGSIGLETFFGLANKCLRDTLSTEEIIQKISINPRKILNLPIPKISEGEPINLTLFETENEWTFTENDILSKSKNTPYINWKMKGKAIRTFNN
jgi:dihydroorotase